MPYLPQSLAFLAVRVLQFLVIPLLILPTGCVDQPDPVRLVHEVSDSQYGPLIQRLSEPHGFFDSDNLISNETSYLHVFRGIDRIGVTGGVYIGVGPDQNFSYISKIRPKYAFIVDIRRGNLIQHILYKAIFELAPSRSEFLSVLFSKPIPDAYGDKTDGPIDEIVSMFDKLPGDRAFLNKNILKIQALARDYDINASSEDLSQIEQIMSVLFEQNLDLRWEWRSPWRRGVYFPKYREILLSKDLDGEYGTYLNRNEDYDFIRRLQEENSIIPVVGNFAGKHTLSEISKYIKDRDEHVSAFYISNVEYYLLPDGVMHQFAMNVRSLPIDQRSVLIRAFVNARWGKHPAAKGNHTMTNVLQYMESFNKLYEEGRYRTYWDIGTADYISLE
jgi:hypothetical protein